MTETIVLGGGCFWCTESVFLHLKGVTQVESGYAGGRIINPSYQEVCQGDTGHAEVIRIDYDPQIVEFTTLLEVFFATHDATTINQQGNDIGSQYRSVIFYLEEHQRQSAEQKIRQLKQQGIPIVTELLSMPTFFPAEHYHQNFFARNPTQAYCNFTIPTKLQKLKQSFPQLFHEP